MNAEIISVGTELLLGEITDTNSAYLGQLFAKLGINVFHKTTVGDNEFTMLRALKSSSEQSDLVVMIGGLGPTEDDITKQTLSKFLNVSLHLDQNAYKKIENYFKKQHRPLTDNNKRQALVLAGSEVIENPNGLAVGLFFHTNGTDYMVLPGPPSEFNAMVDKNIVPLLGHHYGLERTIKSKTLHFVGIGEADLATRINDIVQNQDNPTVALYFKPTDVTIRLTAKASNSKEAEKQLELLKLKIMERVGDYFYAEGDHVSFNDFVVQELIKKKISITAAESLTAGKFQSTLVDTPGASQIFNGGFVTYSNDVKRLLLGVEKETLNNYGVVSSEVAKAMASGAKNKLKTDIAISFTGVAGPDSLEGHEAGTVWIGLALRNGKVIAQKFNFQGSREKVRHLAVQNAFRMIWNSEIK